MPCHLITRILVLLCICCFTIGAIATEPEITYTLYLIRHAEKQADGSRDPVLTTVGVERTHRLADWFSDKHLMDIWSSNYKRTRHTATPLLGILDLKLSIYDPGNQAELVRQLSARRHNALIVGHSNTIPELARLLCDCSIADMGESEHDRLIVISMTDGEVLTHTLTQSSD